MKLGPRDAYVEYLRQNGRGDDEIEKAEKMNLSEIMVALNKEIRQLKTNRSLAMDFFSAFELK